MDPNTFQNNNKDNEKKSMTHSTPAFDNFIKQFEVLSTPLEKLRMALQAMRDFVSQKESLPFREFWEVRKLCVPLFKENINHKDRNQLWNEYIELTREGRELKNILDEEANFASEQIELAILALEKEIETFFVDSASGALEFNKITNEIQALKKRAQFYDEKGHNLNLLNTFAERINALRKELIKIPVRFRFKNKFFQKLSDLGDKVFPPRRDLIKELSFSFEEDVKDFVEVHFSDENLSSEKAKKSVFFYREEIKSLQGIAKVLTLNTQAFTNTRTILSEAWDKLKGMEKELKKHFSEQRQKSLENAALVQEEIAKLKQQIAEIDEESFLNSCEEILQKMRGIELNRSEVLSLKEEIRLLKEPILQKKQEEDRQKKEKEAELFEKKRQEIEDFKKELTTLKATVVTESCEAIVAHCQELNKKMGVLNLSKKEKAECERILKRITHEVEEKKEETLLNLSDDEKKVLENLNDILNQRKERKSTIKKQIDEYRKILGGSSLDIAKVMEINELINAEKDRLEKIEEGIQEVQRKIQELKK